MDVSGSGSADHSASGEISGESSTSSASGDASGSGQTITFTGQTDVVSGDHSASGTPQEAEGGSAERIHSGEVGSTDESGESGMDRQHSGSGVSQSGFISGSGDISGSTGESMVVMVDGRWVEVSRQPKEQELGQGHIETSGAFLESSASGSGVSGSGSGGFSGILFVDHGGVDITVQTSGEQEVSGYRPFESGFQSGSPSGFPSGVSGSASASGDSDQHRGDVIYLTDNEMMEVTIRPMTRHPEQGRGVVEISGQGSASGIHHEFSSSWDHSSHLSGSGDVQIHYTEDSFSQSGHQEESQEGRAGPTYEVTPDTTYTSPTTAPSVSLETPAVVEQPEVEEGSHF